MAITPNKDAMIKNISSNEPVSLGQIRYKINCIGKLIIQVKVKHHRLGSEWIDAKAHHITLTED